MNAFRLVGDMTHLISIIVLLLKIYATKSCSGISLKTQELYAVVFVTRYLDLVTDFISVYNTVMKLVFISSSLAIVWCMRKHKVVKRSYDKELDTFRHWLIVVVCVCWLWLFMRSSASRRSLKMYKERYVCESALSYTVLTSIALVTVPNEYIFRYLSKLVEVPLGCSLICWAFSIYLEAVAILPQLVLLQRSGNVDNLTGKYIFFLGAYRAFYILNWIYRYFTEQFFTRWISCISGIVQTALYADFFYYYFISWKNNSKLQLPA